MLLRWWGSAPAGSVGTASAVPDLAAIARDELREYDELVRRFPRQAFALHPEESARLNEAGRIAQGATPSAHTGDNFEVTGAIWLQHCLNNDLRLLMFDERRSQLLPCNVGLRFRLWVGLLRQQPSASVVYQDLRTGYVKSHPPQEASSVGASLGAAIERAMAGVAPARPNWDCRRADDGSSSALVRAVNALAVRSEFFPAENISSIYCCQTYITRFS